MDSILLQATLYLTAMVIAVPLSVRLGLGSVLGYLLAGIVIGPILTQTGSDPESLQHFAEFGVVMMLFLIGLELNPRGLWEMRHRLLGLGGAQILITWGAITGGLLVVEMDTRHAIAIGMIFALSSTAIVLQTLSEKNLLKTSGGRSAFSVLLTQDIAVIPMLAMLPLLAMPAPAEFNPDGSISRPAMQAAEAAHHSMSLIEGLPGWGVTLVTLAAIVLVVIFGHFLTGPLFRFAHLAKLREIYTALALVLIVSIAFLMMLVGVSPALGAFLAGVVLGNSEFRHELEADIAPFKGLLLGLFFITVGAGIRFDTLWENFSTVIAATLAVMILKGLILYAIGFAFRLRGREHWLFTLSLAQAGEFGFVLVAFATGQHVLPQHLADLLLLIVALSMLLTPLFFILYEYLEPKLGEVTREEAPQEEIGETHDVIIVGIGRFGQVVNRMIRVAGLRAVVLDSDLSKIQMMRRFGMKGYFGDPSRPDLLHAAGLMTAKVLVVANDDRRAAIRLIRYARRARPDLHIIARAHDQIHSYELYRAGANDIVRELFDSSLRAARYVLENAGLSEYEAHEVETTFFRHDRYVVKELADLWDPKMPIEQNPAYVERARELDGELEVAVVSEEQSASEEAEEPSPPASNPA